MASKTELGTNSSSKSAATEINLALAGLNACDLAYAYAEIAREADYRRSKEGKFTKQLGYEIYQSDLRRLGYYDMQAILDKITKLL